MGSFSTTLSLQSGFHLGLDGVLRGHHSFLCVVKVQQLCVNLVQFVNAATSD